MIPQGGATVYYVYDTLDRLTQVQRGTDTFTYAYDGVTEYQYNALNQLTQILNRTSTGDVLSQHAYTYNAQDLRSAEISDGSAIPPLPSLPDTDTTYATNAVNQLLSTTGPDRTFVYDPDGNMTQGYTKDGDIFTVTYDAENRMTSLQYTDSNSVLHRYEYDYDGDGLLAIERYSQNSTLVTETRFVRDGMLAIQDRNGSNATMNEYTWGLSLGGGIGGLLNLNTAGQNYAYLYDGKGNVEAVLDSAQSVVAAYRYDPFGVLLNQTGSLTQPYGFSTKRYNAPVGMVHMNTATTYRRLAVGSPATRWPKPGA
jgi:YD repeat-containing protein